MTSAHPNFRCSRKRSCCTISTTSIPKWKPCAPISSAKPVSTAPGRATTPPSAAHFSIPTSFWPQKKFRRRKIPPPATANSTNPSIQFPPCPASSLGGKVVHRIPLLSVGDYAQTQSSEEVRSEKEISPSRRLPRRSTQRSTHVWPETSTTVPALQPRRRTAHQLAQLLDLHFPSRRTPTLHPRLGFLARRSLLLRHRPRFAQGPQPGSERCRIHSSRFRRRCSHP